MSHALRTHAVLGAAALLVAAACRGSSTESPDGRQNRQGDPQNPNPPQGVACTADYRYGLNVTVLDSVTGARVPAPMLIIATEGAFADTAQWARDNTGPSGFESWPLVGERAGTYAVRVRADGYREWRTDGVRIGRDVCHVIPVRITARLVPNP